MFTKLFRFFYTRLLKPFFFLLEPEGVHDRVTALGRMLGKFAFTKFLTRKMFRFDHKALSQNLYGIDFMNPIGLSAGFDKDAKLTNIFYDVGFGFMQVGSVTLNPYKGNPKTRLYRLPKSKGLVVYYGLKNIGVDKIISKLNNFKQPDLPLSISIAKTNHKSTSTVAGGIFDYLGSLKKLNDEKIGDFYTINISCPNTFGGEPFTTPKRLEKLLKTLSTVKITKPVFVKMPINLDWNDFKKLLDVIVKYKFQGVIIGNLNKDYKLSTIKDDIPEHIKGGISGKPCRELSNHLIYRTFEVHSKKLTIIGVGGVFSAEDAYEKIKLGASLVQLITGMIFEGPQLIGEINKGLVELLNKDSFDNITEAIGSYHNS